MNIPEFAMGIGQGVWLTHGAMRCFELSDPADRKAMIQLKKINHAYHTKSILRDLDLDILDGGLTCLLGSSGSGKSTILRIIAGLEIPQGGQVVMDGKVVTDAGKILVPAAERGIGFVFQDLALWPHFTVYEHIAFGLKELKINDLESKVLEMLDAFGLRKHRDKYPHQLSGGQKQLVAIARSLVLKPKTLLMDEPLSDLDVKLKHRMLEIIKALKQKYDMTIIYVTHDHKEAFALADQVVVLNQGQIEAMGSVSEIKTSSSAFVQYFLEY